MNRICTVSTKGMAYDNHGELGGAQQSRDLWLSERKQGDGIARASKCVGREGLQRDEKQVRQEVKMKSRVGLQVRRGIL